MDDKLHAHSKIRKVLADDPAALALWVVAGSWSSDNLTDGFVPDHQLPWLLPTGAEELAQKLVAARLWRRVRGGFLFHEWTADGDGTRRNPTRVEVEAERMKKAEAGRKGGLTRARNANREANEKKVHVVEEKDGDVEDPSGERRARHRTAEFDAPGAQPSSDNGSSKRQARASASASPGASALLDPPTRPDPYLVGGPSTGVTTDRTRETSEPPPPRCQTHLDDPDPPACRRCADARHRREEWFQTTTARRAERDRTAPRCRTHPSELADNCRGCRADAIAAPTGGYPLVVPTPRSTP